MKITAQNVHKILRKHLLVDGFDIVMDLKKSKGVWLHDLKSGKKFLDMFSFFASLPIGFNHPDLCSKSFKKKLADAAVIKVSNSDIYTLQLAECVEAFSKHAIPKHLPHLFFISGGALAVENALKAAFDWKVRKNFAKGIKTERGHKVIHFEKAFHGRSGYTLSLTNTADPRKHMYFPKFDWPRISSPAIHFPLQQNLKTVEAAEMEALAQIGKAIADNPDDIACILIEPIQGEGGDRQFRKEFFQALRNICDEHDIMLIFDEVQTGFGITGKFWAYQHYGIEPDILSFGKKSQVCGILGGTKLHEVEKHVFSEESRINSTFGGNLIDIVRVTKILEVIHRDKLLKNAEKLGAHLLQSLHTLEHQHSFLSNSRGLGLMCAIDFETTEMRNKVREKCYEKGMIILPCGERSLRFRPTLTVTKKEIDLALSILADAFREVV
ncbi:MAG: L-lysine 6-transaminase [Deltaproteobacteria bacterium CG_4_10_14_0_2_um_filter_43_8]|nr:MAG: L-lysine 6-transaminase [Deltaproteobacteria bacterium CG11_big_fil_rev_8_21_14_0_20_42_23]PJA21159.1 MAG: L-lysine 6-transaminase [Deltaproteobacteria bacterium CG_4_10_14_0_2_um_filter_43_8]PJC65186.1 MAG: L-lysine 6-transaminase [Deltaproteobacteria bacterium CG_4_9_14_0_2_um_filter_42_21]